MSVNHSDFELLVNHIQATSEALQQDVRQVINRSVTTRAWLTGYYIVEYEQQGNDRAKYGDRLLQNLEKRLGDNSFSLSSLKNYRAFYLLYPELCRPVSIYLQKRFGKSQTPFGFLLEADNQNVVIGQTPFGQLPDFSAAKVSKDGFAMQKVSGEIVPVPQKLFDRLSFSNITLLLHVDNPLKRAFYAIEAMRGPWSYRELKRQIDSNYYERSGWSKKPELLADMLDTKAEKASFREELKSHYMFEFLGLTAKTAIEETDLEQAVMDHLQEFILEMGMGFCLEARQKKLLIDDRYYKADLVFYHRILKCHCIVELKAYRLDYADMAQLNLYIEYYRKHYMQPDDNPPVGLLLCTEYGQEMAEYLAPFTDPQLFVARYELQLPSKEKLRDFLMRENRM